MTRTPSQQILSNHSFNKEHTSRKLNKTKTADGLLNHFLFSFRQQHDQPPNTLFIHFLSIGAKHLLLLSSLAGLGATELGSLDTSLDLAGALLDSRGALDGLHVQVGAVAALGVARDGVVDELARRGGGLEGGLVVGLGGLVPVVAELGGNLDLVVLGVDTDGLGVGERGVLRSKVSLEVLRLWKYCKCLPCASACWSG